MENQYLDTHNKGSNDQLQDHISEAPDKSFQSAAEGSDSGSKSSDSGSNGRRRAIKNPDSIKRYAVTLIISGCLFIISLIIFLLSRTLIPAEKVSRFYTDSIFYYISWPLKKIISYFPFSVSEILLYACVITVPAAFIATAVITVKRVREHILHKKRGASGRVFHIFAPIVKYVMSIAALICIAGSAFILFGGINYNSLTFAEKAGYATEEYSVDRLRQLCVYLASEASQSRRQLVLNRDDTINAQYSEYNLFRLTENAEAAYKNMPDKFDYLKRDYPSAKPALSSFIMSNIHITGIYPYILPEAVVNAQTPIMSLPHTICHEMAHQRGFAREDEANFIAYLACISSEDDIFVYSGYYTAFVYAMNQLYTYDPDAWEEIAAVTAYGVWLDSAYEDKFWAQFDTIDSDFTSSVNDTYLTVMNVDDGVHSYGRMVDLLIADAINNGIIK